MSEKDLIERIKELRRWDELTAENGPNAKTFCTAIELKSLTAELAAARARIGELEAALREIAKKVCRLRDGVSNDCHEEFPRDSWCPSCIAREALAGQEEG